MCAYLYAKLFNLLCSLLPGCRTITPNKTKQKVIHCGNAFIASLIPKSASRNVPRGKHAAGPRPARRHRAGLMVDARSRGLVFWKRGEPCFREHPRLGSRVPGRLRVLVARATRFRATSRRPARALPPATTPSSLRVVRLHGAHSIAMRPHANLRSHAQRRTRAPRHEPRVLFPWPDSAPAAALSRPCRLHAHPAPPSDAPRSSPETHWERRGHQSAARATASAPLKGVLAAARAHACHTTSSLLLTRRQLLLHTPVIE